MGVTFYADTLTKPYAEDIISCSDTMKFLLITSWGVKILVHLYFGFAAMSLLNYYNEEFEEKDTIEFEDLQNDYAYKRFGRLILKLSETFVTVVTVRYSTIIKENTTINEFKINTPLLLAIQLYVA